MLFDVEFNWFNIYVTQMKLSKKYDIKWKKMKDLPFLFQVPVASDEAANNIIIELDLDNSLFGFPRELVVAGAGKS